ncbi:MAG TPA: glycosyltransferase family 4 protein [Rubricoccaceae bacterium]
MPSLASPSTAASNAPRARSTGIRPHLLLVITEDWYYWSHRRAVAQAALEAGYRVTLASRFADHRARIEADGVETADIRMRRSGRNPLGEAAAVADLARLYRRLRPDVVHHVAIKPVLYGSVAARAARVPGVVNAVSGLGYAFTGRGPAAAVFGAFARVAYRVALRGPRTWTIFQNDDDRQHFVRLGLVRPERTVLIAGSGVDLSRFRPVPEPPGVPAVLYAGRMLWSKGVGDLVEAVRRLRADGVAVRLVLAGHSDTDNPEAIPDAQLRAWAASGDAEWDGRTDDVAAAMAAAAIIVLVSEREGVPKVLVEAAGAGRAIVATNVPGCRDVVSDGVNGRLVPVHDPAALAAALGELLADPALRASMGAASRRRAEAEFAEPIVVGQTLATYRRALAATSAP